MEHLNEQKIDFESCLKSIYSSNPMVYEQAFSWLVDSEIINLTEYAEELIRHAREESDLSIRSRLVELIGYTDNELAISFLQKELEHPERALREWAVLSLKNLSFEKASSLAKEYQRNHPEEWPES